ncbi:MAG: MFS transporter [Vulcanisaeta sp. AZ3]|jgi:MFS family permease
MRLRWVGLTLASTSFLMSLLLRVFWGPLTPFILRSGVSSYIIGLVGSVFFIGYVIAQLIGGLLADRVGVGAVMGIGLILSGITNMLYGLFSASSWILLSAIIGFFAGFEYAPSVKVIRELFSDTLERAMGIYAIAWALPFMIAAAIVPPLAYYSIKFVFYVIGIMTTIVGIIDIVMLRGINETRTESIIKALGTLRNRNVLLIGLGGFFILYMNWVIAYWLYDYLVDSGLSITYTSLSFTIFTIAGIIAMPLSGQLAHVVGARNILLIDIIVYSLSGVLIALIPKSPYVFLLAALLGVGRFITTPMQSTLIAVSVDRKFVSTATAAANTLWQLSGILAPYMTYLIASIYGMETSIIISSLSLLISLAPYALVNTKPGR